MTLMPAFDPYAAALREPPLFSPDALAKAARSRPKGEKAKPDVLFTLAGSAYAPEEHPTHGIVFRKVALV